MSTAAPVKPKGMLSQDIDAAMNPDLATKPVENSTTIIQRQMDNPVIPPKKEDTIPSKGLLGDMEVAEPVKLTEKPSKTPQESFAELKAKRESAEKRAEQAEKELEKARRGSVDSETFKTRAEAAERELEKAAIERSPRWQREFIQKPKDMLDGAKALAKELEVPEATIDQAAALQGKARRDFIDQNFNSASAVSEITQILHSIDDIVKTRNSELENHKVTLQKEIEAQQEELKKQGIQTIEARVQKFESLLPAVAEKIGAPFKKTGEAVQDANVEANLKLARSLADGTANDEDQAAAPYLAVAARQYMKTAKAQAAHIAKLEARLREYGDHEPMGTHTENNGERTQSTGKPKGLMAKAAEDFGRR